MKDSRSPQCRTSEKKVRGTGNQKGVSGVTNAKRHIDTGE
jgi:hypothetical protein